MKQNEVHALLNRTSRESQKCALNQCECQAGRISSQTFPKSSLWLYPNSLSRYDHTPSLYLKFVVEGVHDKSLSQSSYLMYVASIYDLEYNLQGYFISIVILVEHEHALPCTQTTEL